MQSIVLHTVHLICGSSAVRQVGSVKGTLSDTPVESSGGVEDMVTASIKVGPVGAVVEVIVSVVGMGVTTTCWEVDGPPFSNGTRSTTIFGSLLVFSLPCCDGSTVDGILLSIFGFNSGVASILSSH